LAAVRSPLLHRLSETLQPVVVPAVSAEAWLPSEEYAWLGDVRTALFLPLVMARRLIGVIGLGQVAVKRGYTTSDVNFATTLANQAGVAIHNARLYQQGQRAQPVGTPETKTAATLPTPVPVTAPSATQRPARRLALPVAAVAMSVCVLGALALGAPPIRQALGLAVAATTTATQGAAPTVIQVNTAAPTLAPTRQPASATAVPPTHTAVPPTPTASPTVEPTRTPAPSATSAVSPTPSLPPGVTALATVVLSDGIAGRLRAAPNGTVIGGVPGNSQVQVLDGRVTTDDGIVWVEIRVAETGATGWFAESLLRYDNPPAP
jgi:hypothetical protein